MSLVITVQHAAIWLLKLSGCLIIEEEMKLVMECICIDVYEIAIDTSRKFPSWFFEISFYLSIVTQCFLIKCKFNAACNVINHEHEQLFGKIHKTDMK
jgi:hypothetical protein